MGSVLSPNKVSHHALQNLASFLIQLEKNAAH